ncbi:MAG: O-antigen ligase family protein [Anaerolineae bacterium]|nr:O-antigen ligase family protein [Anaerolineae bacterium]
MTNSTLNVKEHNNKYLYFWETYFLPYALPLLGSIVLSIVVAFLISKDMWILAVPIVSIVPLGILLNLYPLIAIMIWLLLMPFLPFDTVSSYVFWGLHRALIPLAMGLTILARLLEIKDYDPIRLGRAEFSMVLYLVFAAISVLLTQNSPFLYLYELYDRVFVGFAAYWLIRFVSPSERDLKSLLPVFLIITVALIFLGIWSRYAPDTMPAIWNFERWSDDGEIRMSGPFHNPIEFSYTLIFLMVFIFHYAVNCAEGLVKNLLVMLFVMSGASVFLTFTRGCWLALALVLLGLLVLYPRTMFVLVLIALPLLMILAGMFTVEIAYALKRFGTEGTIDSRVVLAHAGQQLFLHKPLFGWGFAGYDLHAWRFIERVGNAAPTKWDVEEGTSHNTYLTVLAETGLIGFILYLFPFLWWLKLTIKVFPRLPQEGFWSRRLLLILWFSIGAYFIVSQFVDMRFSWFPNGNWWLSLGIIASIVQQYMEKEDTAAPKWIQQVAQEYGQPA